MVIAQRSQKLMLVWCMSEDLQCKENDRKSKIGGHRRVSDGQTHHPLPTEIVTVLSHHVIGEEVALHKVRDSR